MGVRRAIRRLRRVLFGPRNATEIDRVTAALQRHEAKVDDMANQWRPGDCCPSCMFGHRYTDACKQADRTAQWLAVLLRRRGRPEDLARIQSIEFEHPLPKRTRS